MVAYVQSSVNLPVVQMWLNIFKRVSREFSGRCLAFDSGSHQDPPVTESCDS